MGVPARSWTGLERELWQRLSTHPFEDPAVGLDFTRRLARQMNWPLPEARAAVEEYRRFCFLACVTTEGPVTPSEQIDEVWHLHLTYSRDYWDRWCAQALRRSLHHDPTTGQSETPRFRVQYAHTLALYEAYFGPPPVAYWPGTAERFAAAPRYRMIDRRRAWIVPRPSLGLVARTGLAAIFGSVAAPASADIINPLDLPGPQFLGVYGLLAVLAIAVTVMVRRALTRTGRSANARGLNAVEVARVGGGIDRAADTLFLALAERGAASFAAGRITIARAPRTSGDIALLQREVEGTFTRRAYLRQFRASAGVAALDDRLVRRNLLLDAAGRWRLRLATLLPFGAVLLLGLCKIGVGLSRGKPVGFLVVASIFGTAVLWIIMRRERYATSEGREAIEAMKSREARAVRAPVDGELPLAFALVGATALVGTPHAAYAQILQSSGGSGGSDGSGCGGGGDSGGGGGCGGCSG